MRDFIFSVLFSSLLVLTSTCVKGQYQVIGSPEPIVAAPGDDVILPCQVDSELNVEKLTVEWSNPDLKPDPGDRLKHFVHLYRHSSEDPTMQMEAYRGRTTLFKDDLKHGNISLKIFNVSKEDAGTYKCFIPKLQGRQQFSTIQLIIDSARTRTTEMPQPAVGPGTSKGKTEEPDHRVRLIPLVVVFVVLGLGSALCIHCVSRRKKNPDA